MDKKCDRCDRLTATKKHYCAECVALVASRSAVVHVKISSGELDLLAEVLEGEAANLRATGGGDWDREAATLEEYAKWFREHAGYERTAQAEDAKWRQAQE